MKIKRAKLVMTSDYLSKTLGFPEDCTIENFIWDHTRHIFILYFVSTEFHSVELDTGHFIQFFEVPEGQEIPEVEAK